MNFQVPLHPEGAVRSPPNRLEQLEQLYKNYRYQETSMKNKISIIVVTSLLTAICACSPDNNSKTANTSGISKTDDFHQWALTPPMGWNSWDIFGTAITEKQAREQADAMEKYLLPSGYDIFTVDIQ